MQNRALILLTVIMMDLLTGTELDLFVPSFPELKSHFNLTIFWVEALLSINFIGYCGSLFFVGGLSDRYGRKPIILLGLLVFGTGSIMCTWPPSYIFLLIGRFLQGVGVAAPAILSFLIIADSYPIKEQQFLLAMLNGSLNIAAGIAPVIGSYVTLYFHWQGNFALLLLLGLIVLIMTIFLIPSTRHTIAKESISLRGIKGYFEIFRSQPLILLITHLLFLFTPYWVFTGMSPLLYIKDLHVSLYYFGYYQGILAIVFAIGSIIYGLLLKNIQYDQRKMLNFSLKILLASTLAMFIVTFIYNINPLLITSAMLIYVIAQIIPTTILYPLCLNYLPHAKGRVSALLQGSRLILTAIGLQIAAYIYDGTFQNIGIILIIFIAITMMTLVYVMNNRKLISA